MSFDYSEPSNKPVCSPGLPKPKANPLEDKLDELIECLKKAPRPTGEIITDGPLCGATVFSNLCKQRLVWDRETGCYLEIDMSESELNVPQAGTEKVFESEILDFVQVQADTPVATVQDALDAAVAAGLPDLYCKETGQSIPATIDDICEYKVRRLPCGSSYLKDPADATSAIEVGADDMYYVGGISINTAEDTYGAVDPTRPVATGADAVAAWCFKLRRSLSKADLAALEK